MQPQAVDSPSIVIKDYCGPIVKVPRGKQLLVWYCSFFIHFTSSSFAVSWYKMQIGVCKICSQILLHPTPHEAAA